MFASPTDPSPAPLVGVLADLAAWDATPRPPGRPAPTPTATAPRPGTLAALVAEVDERFGRLDAATCTGEQAAEVVTACARIMRRCEATQLAALARVDETRAFASDGSRTARAWTMRNLDIPYARADKLVECAGRLRDQPHLARLAASGQVGAENLTIAGATIAERPDTAVAVCQAATGQDRATFARTCRRLRQAGVSDEDRVARHHRDRRADTGIDDEGRFTIHALGPADQGAELLALLQPWVDDLLRASWRDGTGLTPQQARWDALLAVCRAAAEPGAHPRPATLTRSGGSRAKVIVRIDLTALTRGWVAAGETCDLSGAGDVDVDTVRRLLRDGAFLTAVLTAPDGTVPLGHRVTDVAHLGRPGPGLPDDPDRLDRFLAGFLGHLPDRLEAVEDLVHHQRPPSAAQRTALEYLHPTCSVAGCSMTVGLEVDHIHPWIDTRETRLTDLDRKCGPHHAEKTRRENAQRAAARRADPPAA